MLRKILSIENYTEGFKDLAFIIILEVIQGLLDFDDDPVGLDKIGNKK